MLMHKGGDHEKKKKSETELNWYDSADKEEVILFIVHVCSRSSSEGLYYSSSLVSLKESSFSVFLLVLCYSESDNTESPDIPTPNSIWDRTHQS